MSAFNLRIEAPFRPVDWRWEKARLMREDPQTASLLRHQDDEWTIKAKKFQEKYKDVNDDYDRLLLLRRWPALSEAADIRFRDDEKRLVRYEIEARLLASEPFERIAEKVGASVESIIWYEKVFFNVLDRLHNEGWVCHCVIGEAIQAGLTERDYDVLWKIMGYYGKSLVLDAIIRKTFDTRAPETQSQVGDFLVDDIEKTAKLKTAIAFRTMSINSYTQERIIELYKEFQALKKAADGDAGSGDQLSSNIQVMIQNLGWTIGNRNVMVSASDPQKIVGRLRSEVVQADECAAELRADDLMQLNIGQTPERLKALATTRFPEKKDAAAKQGS